VSAPPLAAAASLIWDETGYEEGRPGTHFQLEGPIKVQKPTLKVSAEPPYTKDHGPGCLVGRPSPKGRPSSGKKLVSYEENQEIMRKSSTLN
jgi:hypothetical protein